jgi:excisionase family DNA binding protein
MDQELPSNNINLNARIYTVREAAAVVGLSERALRHRLSRGEGPRIIRLGVATIRIHEDDLRRWIQVEEVGS